MKMYINKTKFSTILLVFKICICLHLCSFFLNQLKSLLFLLLNYSLLFFLSIGFYFMSENIFQITAINTNPKCMPRFYAKIMCTLLYLQK